MKELAVLLPLYYKNDVSILAETINSLKIQTFNNFDLYICEDGPLTAEAYHFLRCQEEFLDIFYVKNEKAISLAKNLNSGLRKILEKNYNFIARLDGDDICIKDRFENQIHFLKNNVACDVVGGYIREFNSFNSITKIIKYPLTHEQCFDFFKKRSPFAHPAVVFRRSFFEKAGLYPTESIQSYSFISPFESKLLKKLTNNLDTNFINFGGREDTLLWFMGFYHQCIFSNIPEVVLNYRLDDYNFKNRKVSFRRSKQMLFERFIINKHLNYGFKAYLYAIGRLILESSPGFLKKLMYKYMR